MATKEFVDSNGVNLIIEHNKINIIFKTDIKTGDFIFASWKKEADKQYRRKVHELRCAGYRKIGVEHDSLNMYEHYRRKENNNYYYNM